jgi:hypothetical protein
VTVAGDAGAAITRDAGITAHDGCNTVTVTVCGVSVPPAPAQVIVNDLFVVMFVTTKL